MIALPAPVDKALRCLRDNGYDAYVVGGCVRDALLKNEPSDWDITTSALPRDICHVFRDEHVILTGMQHGTVTVIIDNTPLEITTYRVDGTYSDGRHPDAVHFTPRLSEDLARRDFTVNAMAYAPQTGVIDPFGGREDLRRATIRCVGDPVTRFAEDSLRILRALRFASTLDFTIDPSTSSAIHELCHLLEHISIERVTAELKKLLCGNNARNVLLEYQEIVHTILPELDGSAKAYRTNAACVDKAPSSLSVRLALLLSSLTAIQAEATLRRLRFDNQTIHIVASVLSHLGDDLSGDAQLRRLIGQIGYDNVYVLSAVRRALNEEDIKSRVDTLRAHNACCAVADLSIGGNDLISLGYAPGPMLGTTLHALLEEVIEGRLVNDRTHLLSIAAKHLNEQKERR